MADNILTRNIGPFPGWVWGGAAVLGGLLFFAARSGKRQAAGTTSASALSPAASVVPFVPNVSVSGIPGGATASSLPNPLAPGPGQPGAPTGSGTFTVTYPAGTWIYLTPSVSGPAIANIPVGTQLSLAGALVQGDTVDGVSSWAPVTYGGIKGYVSGARGTIAGASGGGSGGWGQAGQAAPGGFMGWTWLAGWPGPVGSGTSLGQRTGLQRAGAGAGAASSVNRTGVARKGKIPLRRRTLTGR